MRLPPPQTNAITKNWYSTLATKELCVFLHSMVVIFFSSALVVMRLSFCKFYLSWHWRTICFLLLWRVGFQRNEHQSHIRCLVSSAWCIIGFDLQKEVKITCIQLKIDAVWCSKCVPTWNKHNTYVSTRFFRYQCTRASCTQATVHRRGTNAGV